MEDAGTDLAFGASRSRRRKCEVRPLLPTTLSQRDRDGDGIRDIDQLRPQTGIHENANQIRAPEENGSINRDGGMGIVVPASARLDGGFAVIVSGQRGR